MPKSIETSSEFDFSNEHQHQSQSNASASSHGGKQQQQQQQDQISVAVAAAASNSSKRYRHQNFSKNIYIGTKNAEKWEKVRSVLSFKNDVEFVSYLLKLAEIDLSDNNGLHSRESFTAALSASKSSSKKGSNEKFTTDTDTDQESLPASFKGNLEGAFTSSLKACAGVVPKALKKMKRVQFQDGLSPGTGPSPPPPTLLNRSNRPVTPTILPGIPILAAARLFESAAEFRRESMDDDEVLDCRIAEKIKTELKEYNKGRSEGKNLSLLRSETLEAGGEGEEEEEDDDERDDNPGLAHHSQEDPDGNGKDNGEEDDEDDEEEEEEAVGMESNSVSESGTDFEKALLAAALKQTTEVPAHQNKRLPKRKGRPPTKNKAKAADTTGTSPRKRGPAKLDIRKAPPHEQLIPSDFRATLKQEGGESAESDNDLSDDEEEQFHNNSENSMDSEKGYECSYCDAIHTLEECPIRQARSGVSDFIEKFRWMEENKDILEKIRPDPSLVAIKPEDDELGDLLEDETPDEELNDASSDEDESMMEEIKVEESNVQAQLMKKREEEEMLPSYCDATIPDQFDVVKSEVIGSKVVARTRIPKHMRLGPLVGELIHVKDIPDDCTMKEVYEIHDGAKSHFISTSNKNEANWLRYIRPAPTRDQRNVVVVWLGGQQQEELIDERNANVNEVYFITTRDIDEGCELFYWSDHMNSAWGRKKIDKMNCGGCNLKFEHPLYYRTHCSVFHDPAFSLTIRKYHCKVCGVAVLGKDNIMQHAAEMHDGKGAYQCQFCKKYFLRLNYLEMHRTYGCSANPQRARPLCDFCGRKFCQPQKLKVHIKRMHSADMADVLRDFQCKLCSKLLGSRAALQRHSKEVHSRNSAVVSCPRCQKLFQNRSNLKIHMLTHSGVRPFKCAEGGCSAAFTTKQCLQFHYKKVHGYTQEQMPKIERSIAYTFDAYSGGMKIDFLAEQLPRRRRKVSADDSKSLMQNFATAITERKRAKANESDTSIGDLCKSEPNLSLLSSKISSLLSQELKHAKKLKKKMLDTIINNPDSNSGNNLDAGLFKKAMGGVVGVGGVGVGCGGGGGGVGGAVGGGITEENLNAFKMRLFQTAAAGNAVQNDHQHLHHHHHNHQSMHHQRDDDMGEDEEDNSKDSILGNAPNSAQINLVETFLNSSTNGGGGGNHLGLDAQNSLQLLQSQLTEQSQNPFNVNVAENNFNINSIVRNKDFITPTSAAILSSAGLIQSKGSKKWMDDQVNNGNNEQQQHHHLHLHQQQQQQQQHNLHNSSHHHHPHSMHQQHNQQQNPGSSSSSNLLPVNRNFLSRLINNGSKFGNCAVDNDDESSILDVVDNQNAQNKNSMANQIVADQQQQQQQQQQLHQNQYGNATSSFQEQISQLSGLSSLAQLPHSSAPFAHHQLPHNSLASFGNAYCNNQGGSASELSSAATAAGTTANEDPTSSGNNNGNSTDIGRIVGSASTPGPGNASASLLVEAALNSVTNMIEGNAGDQVDNNNCEALKSRLSSTRNERAMNNMDVDIDSMPNHGPDNEQTSSAVINPAMASNVSTADDHLANEDLESSMRNSSGSFNDMHEIENEVKLMKSLNNFHCTATGPNSVQFPMSHQSSSSSTNGQGNQTSALNANNSEMMHENEIDVDSASTPRTLDRDSTGFRNYPPTTTPSPRDISPGQDYNQQSQRSVGESGLSQQQQQQLFGIQSPIMGRNNNNNNNNTNNSSSYQHHMNEQLQASPSPASTVNQHNASPPILPRYGFSLNDICRKRDYNQSSLLLQQQHQQQQHQQQQQQQQQQQHQIDRRDHHLSSDEDSIMAQNLSVNHVGGVSNNSEDNLKLKASSLEHSYKYSDQGSDLSDLRLKYSSNENNSTMELAEQHFQRLPSHNNVNHSSSNVEQMNSELGLDMSSRIPGYPHHNFQLSAAAAAAGLNRYHHHIYDILSEREQQPNQQLHLQNTNDHQLQLQQEQHMMLAQQQQQQQDSSSHQMNDQVSVGGGGLSGGGGNPDQDISDQTTSVDLSRTTSYVVTSPPSLPYAGHPHSDMLRMVSMELNGVNGGNVNAGNMIATNNHRSFLSGTAGQHNSRMDAMESLHHHHHHRLLTSAEQHRLLASNTAAAAEQLNPGTNRLLVDPAHLLMESNNRSLLSATADTSRLLGDSRHMVQGRDFGSYHHHHHHQVAANNYHHHGGVHHPLVRPSAQSNHHAVGTNYHPFPTYY